jgi:hypothetical protein
MSPNCTPYYPFEPDRVYYQLRLTDQAASGIAHYYMGQREDTTGEDIGDTVVTYVSERLARNIGSVAMYLDHSNANKPPMAIVFSQSAAIKPLHSSSELRSLLPQKYDTTIGVGLRWRYRSHRHFAGLGRRP